MTRSIDEQVVPDELECPTCGARQPWSDACRRCRCDLSLLVRCRRRARAERVRCLRLLRDGEPTLALEHARHHAALVGAADGAWLLATCHLLCRHWPAALALTRAERRRAH